MFTPQRSSVPGQDSLNIDHSTNSVLTLQSAGMSVVVTHDGFSIGASRQCDLTINEPSIPALHSVIHQQGGAIWIESADENTMLTVNDRPYRRMALRHDDRFQIGSMEFRILMTTETVAVTEQATISEDLTLLTAEELCDRILSEQSMVAEFVDGQRAGWEALLRAIEAADLEQANEHLVEQQAAKPDDEKVVFDAILEEIQALSETITDRTKELSHQEKDVLESTTILEESQQRIDQILDQLTKNDPPNELRASA